MSSLIITLLAYLIDKKFGEFTFLTHPIIRIGALISYFEKNFYKDSIIRGALLVLFVLSIISFLSLLLLTFLALLPTWLSILLSAFIASMFIAHNMLRSSVLEVLSAENKKEAISMLVSRDTENMSESDIYKASIETYAENLSDGVFAPLFYLLFFGLPGIFVYKAVNTMDSMVGYRNEKYEKYGKVAAITDDILNFIPSRLTALLIMFLTKQKNPFAFYKNGSQHESPNAGHPITAMALALGIKLGGDTSYFSKIKKKPYFGRGRKVIVADDVKKALEII